MSTVIVFFAARFQSIDLIVNEIFIEANCKQKTELRVKKILSGYWEAIASTTDYSRIK